MSFVMPNTIVNEASRDARPVQANFAAVTAALQNDYLRADGTIALTGSLALGAEPTAANDAATKAYVDASHPPGVILDYGGDTAPNEFWSLCQGQLVSKDDNPILWTLFADTYGTSTATQFYLPDLRSRFVVGKGTATWSNVLGESGGSKDAVVVSHNHSATTASDSHTHTATTASDSHTHSVSGTTGTDAHNHTATVSSGGDQQFYWNGTTGPGYWFAVHDPEGFTTSSDSHSHSFSDTSSSDSHSHSLTTASDSHNHTVTVNSDGVSGTDKNLPPYITLNKIIRLG